MNAQTTDHDHDASSSDGQRGVRLTTLILLIIIALLFIWYMVADRLTPFTASARMQAYVVAVVPDVSGFITEVPVKKTNWPRWETPCSRSRPEGSISPSRPPKPR